MIFGGNFHVHIFGTKFILFLSKVNEGLKLGFQIKKTTIQLRGVDEYKRAIIFINTSTFLQFLLHISMWCHFNGMLIMESCAYSLIWIWRNVKCVKKLPISRFGWNKWYLIAPFNDTTFTKGPLVFIIQFFNANFKKVIGYY